jgi:inorganic pyrophosphatase
VTVYRVAEPDETGKTAASADAFHATYPDRAQDAETLLVAPDGTLFIVTKGDTGPVALYRFPRQLTPGDSHRLTLVGVLAEGRARGDAQITDGTVSADGRWVVLRTNTAATFYPAAEFFRGVWRERYRVDVRPAGEPQGEGIALSADGATLFLAGEGGSSTRPGTLARMTCALPGEAHQGHVVPQELPPAGAAQLVRSLEASRAHRSHLWRDTPPANADDSVNAYVEIAKGNRDKWEFDMGRNRLGLDRVIPEEVGGYPVNYGFVPQTVSYDGDPFDALVLGPPLPEGEVVSGTIVGVMFMEDEKGWDAKVVLSPAGPDGRPRLTLTEDDRQTIGEFFRRYKQHESGKFSTVPGWGSIPDGRRYVTTTHAFFERCRQVPPGAPCRLEP